MVFNPRIGSIALLNSGIPETVQVSRKKKKKKLKWGEGKMKKKLMSIGEIIGWKRGVRWVFTVIFLTECSGMLCFVLAWKTEWDFSFLTTVLSCSLLTVHFYFSIATSKGGFKLTFRANLNHRIHYSAEIMTTLMFVFPS